MKSDNTSVLERGFKSFKSIKPIWLLILVILVATPKLQAQINFSTQSNYKYLKGSQATSLSTDWSNTDFDDNGWGLAAAPFRYGDGTGGTELTDMNGNYSTVFLRSTFTVEQLSLLKQATISADWDDGFVLWINGKEVLARQAPDIRNHNAIASALHESGTPESFPFQISQLDLVEGENSIAVLACNFSLEGSSDFYFDMSIKAFPEQPELPEIIDSVGLSFNKSSGFYETNFDLTISSPIADVKIVYTLDGSNPQNSNTRIISENNNVVVNIDPSSTADRGTTPAVVLRASIIKDGFNASKPKSRTFIYLENVKTQSHPGWNWPTNDINEQVIDLAIDPDVVNSNQYKDLIDDALKDLPSLSVVTDNANLFDPSSGIYVNAKAQGINWERECSAELIFPDGKEGFNVNAGLRIRGGYSRNAWFRKHSFRLFFREQYGDNKLYFPLFEDEGVSEFDKIDLRCAQNYSWANSAGQFNTFIREVFARDSQKATGQPYTRSRYYHLYLNGMYWGIYQTQERAEARYASDYFGGDKEDYDVIKISGENGSKDLIATDGNINGWRKVWDITQEGYTSNKNYFKLEGKDINGNPVKNGEILVDIDNLIDYMINIIYTGNYDAPVSAFASNKRPNNMYIIGNREDKSSGFKFFVHDAEHTLMIGKSAGPGIGLQENRANIGDRTDNKKMLVSEFKLFHIQWLHYRLSRNKEYRVRFADRAYEQLKGKGIFTPTKCIERFNKRASQIDKAIIGESARWGDSDKNTPYTRDADWIPELNNVRNKYFPFRTNIVIGQLSALDLFPSINAPIVKKDGLEVLDQQVMLNSSAIVSMSNPSTTGDIYYTLDGTDPRKIGGSARSSAKKLEGATDLSIDGSVVLSARILNNGKWSALKKIDFIAEQTDYSDLKVTELHYHPLDDIIGSDTTSGKSYEFIEFKNVSSTAGINLSGLVIDSAIYYEFPENYILAPQQYFVVAAKPKKFYARYGMLSSGNFKNSFSNSGEQVIVTNEKGEVIIDFSYSDKDPWTETPDGEGPSLSAVESNPTGNPGDFDYWEPSSVTHGSPFASEGSSGGVITEIAEPLSGLNENTFEVFPNPTASEISIRFNSAQKSNFNLEIFDLNGALLHSQSSHGQVHISLVNLNLKYGIYVLKLESEFNSGTEKLIYFPN